MTVIKSSDYKYLGIYKRGAEIKWSSFKFSADIDYLSFILQYTSGLLPHGTVAWIMQQMIEKYCKAILRKANPEKYTERLLKSPSDYGHKLDILWKEIKTVTSEFRYLESYEKFVEEVNKITTDTRYSNYSMGMNLGLIETYIILGCEFRYELLELEEFNKKVYGIEPGLFLPGFPIKQGIGFDTIVNYIIHIAIEHGISVSNVGIDEEIRSKELLEARIRFSQKGNNKEIEKSCKGCLNK